MVMRGAGRLEENLAFESPDGSTSDGFGGEETGWNAEFTLAGGFRFLRGGEVVQAARLEGRQPVVVTLRNSTEAALIRADWRFTDERTLTIYNIRTNPVLSEDRGYYEITAESGVAV